MPELTEKECILRALEKRPTTDGRFHLGLRFNDLNFMFAHQYPGAKIEDVVWALVKEQKIIIVNLKWQRPERIDGSAYPRKAKIDTLRLMYSAPYDELQTVNPILYLREKVPKNIETRLFRTERMLERILRE